MKLPDSCRGSVEKILTNSWELRVCFDEGVHSQEGSYDSC